MTYLYSLYFLSKYNFGSDIVVGETGNIRAIGILVITWADVFTGPLGQLPEEAVLRWHF